MQPHVISVVIPTAGRSTTQDVRDALAQQSLVPDEICVVEDRDRRGPAWARNRGVERTRGDIVAFLDDDTIPPQDWLASMVCAFDETGVDGAGGSFIESDPLLDDVRRQKPLPQERIIEGFSLVGNSGNLLLRRGVLEHLQKKDGYVFDESFGCFGSEDWELVMRLKRDEVRLAYVPAHVRHLRRVTAISYMEHQFNRGIGIALLHKAVRRAGQDALPQQSILWEPERSRAAKLLGVVKTKIVGPINITTFRRKKHFAIHWAAEKAQSLGYLWGVTRYGR